ncbi:MAG: trypsin-like peptidase domain-containing protein [Nitrospirota bacterium]|nr:trypsin-like peptidase domain-containing protein [Nitrospirota bacterium]
MTEEEYRRLVGVRARRVCRPEAGPVDSRKYRKELEGHISDYYEKIHKENNLLPARFLEDGAGRARAVCRVVIRDTAGVIGGYGTGFLIAPELIMTNNHVLPTIESARGSVAEFGYEEDQVSTSVTLKPDLLYITDENLDFTIVACRPTDLGDIEPVPLTRNPAMVTRSERVNIIQHPQARRKEVALHQNKVIKVLDKVVHYTTDTEPGSSGSPVFNNDWGLVALHHAGWSDGGTVTNEGIRVSAIVRHLLARLQRQQPGREAAHEVLRSVQDTSPFLGFFDLYGVADPGRDEIEVPDFSGSADFADLGFWNIEHFNRTVSNRRVSDVADICARLSMDAMGLTEVSTDAMDRLIADMGQRGFAMGYELEDVQGSQEIAVLYDRETTTVTKDPQIPARYQDKLAKKTASGKSAFPRLPLFARCSVSGGNSKEVKFLMIVVHLKAFGDAQSAARRKLAAEVLSEIIADIREREDLPVVLGGDFNERINRDVLSSLTGSPDLFALTADDASTNAISYVGGSHRSLIDHILVSNDVRMGDIQGDDAAIVRLDRSVADFANTVSDHVPVVFRMVMRENGVDRPGAAAPGAGVTLDIPQGAGKVTVGFE